MIDFSVMIEQTRAIQDEKEYQVSSKIPYKSTTPITNILAEQGGYSGTGSLRSLKPINFRSASEIGSGGSYVGNLAHSGSIIGGLDIGAVTDYFSKGSYKINKDSKSFMLSYNNQGLNRSYDDVDRTNNYKINNYRRCA